MKKKKFSFLIPAAIGIAMGFMACSENYVYEIPKINGEAFNPSQPVTVSEILPDSGGYLTQFVIKGSNFGTDPSKIDVIFNGNRKATVVSSNGTTLYGICPKIG